MFANDPQLLGFLRQGESTIRTGAGVSAVLRLIARQALAVIIAGLAGSFALTRVIKSALVGVTATDSWGQLGLQQIGAILTTRGNDRFLSAKP